MNKVETIKLKNGLTVYLYSDKRRHSTFFQFNTFVGGITKHFVMDNKEYCITDGAQHILEHYVVECNDLGNFLDKLGRRQMSTNASTSTYTTSYYFETVLDVKYGIETLLDGIYNVRFSKEKLDKLKNPIIQEIRGRLDNKFYHANRMRMENTFKNLDFIDVGGTIEEIEKISIDDIKVLYDAFYQPSNQFIVVAGNFNKKEVIQTIRNFYRNHDIFKHKVNLVPYSEDNTVNKKRDILYFSTPMDYLEITFKIDISKYSNTELLDLDYYLHSFYSCSFGVTSMLYKKLVNNKIILDYISCQDMIIDKYLLVTIGAYTKNTKILEKEILDEVMLLKGLNNQDFMLDKKNSLLHMILRDENIFRMIGPFINNIVYYNYPYLDTLEDIQRMNYDDMVNIIKSLDFSNYSVLIIKNKKE